jgi:hypothetical protein
MIRLAVLTSYSQAPMETKIRELAILPHIDALNLYCFRLKDFASDSTIISPFKNLDPKHMADMLGKIIRDTSTSLDIAGLTAYLPNLAMPKQTHQGKRREAVQAVKRLLSLIAALRAKGFSCKTLELVAGQTVILQKKRNGKIPPKLRYISRDQCFQALAESFQELKPIVYNLFDKDPPILAFGIDAGICQLVSDMESLNRLAGLVRKFTFTGLNLDIGHLQIAGISPSEIHPGIIEQIASAHVSDNGNAHFADLPIANHKEKIFRKWLKLLATCPTQPQGKFQRHISIELEACGNVDPIRATLIKAHKLL